MSLCVCSPRWTFSSDHSFVYHSCQCKSQHQNLGSTVSLKSVEYLNSHPAVGRRWSCSPHLSWWETAPRPGCWWSLQTPSSSSQACNTDPSSYLINWWWIRELSNCSRQQRYHSEPRDDACFSCWWQKPVLRTIITIWWWKLQLLQHFHIHNQQHVFPLHLIQQL